ncbi:WYL domain-containing protein [Aquitalea sp.]|uniref:helix-turn-helix transcriptional regulator n=1 Tax=Aquitalea sp. TaxID=1872623 RepID=UPI00258C5779|nr:WYL domain-containing protein [Aquitalea sp.]
MSNVPNKVASPKTREWSLTVMKRMQHIERCLFWRGELQRADLINEFGINPIQAAKDFRAYMEQFPGAMVYRASIRRYVPMSDFKPSLISPTTLDEFVEMQSTSVPVTGWPLPTRNATPSVLQVMVSAVREHQMIEVKYQSMTGERPEWRWLSPHAFASDDERWHVRAYCHTRGAFRDFVLGRILETRGLKGSEVRHEDDLDWHTQVDVLIMPNPNLALDQRKAIATEYQIPHDSLEVMLKVKKSMLFYLMSKFDLANRGNPAAQQLFVTILK